MLSESPEPNAEEWAIHDTNALPSGLVGEYTSLETVAALAECYAEHDPEIVDAFFTLEYHDGKEPDEWAETINDSHPTRWPSLEEFGWNMAQESGIDVDSHIIQNHFDAEGYARSLCNGPYAFVRSSHRPSDHRFASPVLILEDPSY